MQMHIRVHKRGRWFPQIIINWCSRITISTFLLNIYVGFDSDMEQNIIYGELNFEHRHHILYAEILKIETLSIIYLN